jgi:pectate lyase
VGNATAVDYDNIVVAQVGQSPIYDLRYAWCNGSLAYTIFYATTGSGNWSCDDEPGGLQIMRQTATADIARAVIGGGPTDDQVIDSRVRLTAVNGSDRWLGVIARYVDASNYYYLTLRDSNTVSLRKLVNGVAIVLATADLPVTLNTWYDLRLDAVGNELRAFVNNVQVLQTTDASHPAGRTGMMTYKAGAEFSNFISWQP